MAKSIIKFAGPDSQDSFKVLSVKGPLVVDPGKIYSRRVQKTLAGDRTRYDVTTVKPIYDKADGDDARGEVFLGTVRNDLNRNRP